MDEDFNWDGASGDYTGGASADTGSGFDFSGLVGTLGNAAQAAAGVFKTLNPNAPAGAVAPSAVAPVSGQGLRGLSFGSPLVIGGIVLVLAIVAFLLFRRPAKG